MTTTPAALDGLMAELKSEAENRIHTGYARQMFIRCTDALRSQADEIERLKAERDEIVSNGQHLLHQLGQVKAQLAAAESRCAALEAALRKLVPADFDAHPQDFMPEWHDAIRALATEVKGNGS